MLKQMYNLLFKLFHIFVFQSIYNSASVSCFLKVIENFWAVNLGIAMREFKIEHAIFVQFVHFPA